MEEEFDDAEDDEYDGADFGFFDDEIELKSAKKGLSKKQKMIADKNEEQRRRLLQSIGLKTKDSERIARNVLDASVMKESEVMIEEFLEEGG